MFGVGLSRGAPGCLLDAGPVERRPPLRLTGAPGRHRGALRARCSFLRVTKQIQVADRRFGRTCRQAEVVSLKSFRIRNEALTPKSALAREPVERVVKAAQPLLDAFVSAAFEDFDD